MTAVPFDTLKLSRKLESGGFTQDQAHTAAEALADAMAGAELATKTDLRNEIQVVRNEVQALRSELKSDIALSKRDMTIRIGSMFVVAVGVLLAAMRFMTA